MQTKKTKVGKVQVAPKTIGITAATNNPSGYKIIDAYHLNDKLTLLFEFNYVRPGVSVVTSFIYMLFSLVI